MLLAIILRFGNYSFFRSSYFRVRAGNRRTRWVLNSLVTTREKKRREDYLHYIPTSEREANRIGGTSGRD